MLILWLKKGGQGTPFWKWIFEVDFDMDFGSGFSEWIFGVDFGSGFPEWILSVDFLCGLSVCAKDLSPPCF